MKKILILSLLFTTFTAYAGDNGLDARNQMLDAEISRLTKERDEKYTALKECEKTTEGFKIAGITTLIATGVGIYGNIKLYQKYHNTTPGAKGSNTSGKDTRSTEQKANADCDLFCSAGLIEEAEKIGCKC